MHDEPAGKGGTSKNYQQVERVGSDDVANSDVARPRERTADTNREFGRARPMRDNREPDDNRADTCGGGNRRRTPDEPLSADDEKDESDKQYEDV